MTQLERLAKSPFIRQITLHGRGELGMGMQKVTPSDSYIWDGQQRGGNPKRPLWLFQLTLSGWGIFQSAGASLQVPVGSAFCAKIPSAHRYQSARNCPAWHFCWVIVYHPYIADRLLKRPELVNSLIKPPPRSGVTEALLGLFIKARGSADDFEIEAALFRWMLELERHAKRQDHPLKEREMLLKFVHQQVQENMPGFFDVDHLAAAWGTSRSNFSHYFHRLTDQSPAAYIRNLRIQEAARLLEQSQASIKEIAAQTGFADSNHLCKAFRAHWQTSPGDYRRLVGRQSAI